MKSKSRMAIAVVATLLTISATALAQHGPGQQQQGQRPGATQLQQGVDRGRMQDHDRMDQQDRQKAQAQQKAQDQAEDMATARQQDRDIYGYQLMTEQERDEYRERIANAETKQEREQITAEHRAAMQTRAAEKGIDLDEND